MSPSSITAEFGAVKRGFANADGALLSAVRGVLRTEVSRKHVAPRPLPEPFWRKPGGFLLRDVWFDPKDDVFVVAFNAGPMYRVPRSKLSHPGIVFAVALDEFRHGVAVAFTDGTSTDFASDWILFECEDTYKNGQPSRASAPDFGKRVREIRFSKGLKAVEVASACGMAPSNYARLEASKHRPSLDTLGRVADALKVPLGRLVASAE